MFSGIVEALGTVSEIRAEPPGCWLIIREPRIAAETAVADSICVNGCCLTVVAVEGETFAFQAGPETLARTNLGDLQPGSPVNLERSLAVNARLGGHFVSGHIDGVGTLLERIDSGDWSTFWFSVPRALARQMASQRLDRRRRREPDHRRQRARPLQRGPDPLHARGDDARHAWPSAAR